MRREPVDWVMSPWDGIGAGGRMTFEGAAGAALAGLTARLATLEAATGAALVDLTTRLVMGSAAFASTGLASTGLTSAGFHSAGAGSAGLTAASTGRGRGNGFATATAGAGAGSVTTDPNIGDGCRPACRNSALVMMAKTAATASAPAPMSFGLATTSRT